MTFEPIDFVLLAYFCVGLFAAAAMFVRRWRSHGWPGLDFAGLILVMLVWPLVLAIWFYDD